MNSDLHDKIGQMLVFGWQCDDDDAQIVNSHAKRLIEELRVGGVILMGRNVSDRSSTRRMLDQLQTTSKTAGLPKLFVATDQEGGRVARFGPTHYPAYPSAKDLGTKGSELGVRQNASAIGRMLADVGVNWALMPVLDVNNNPNNKVIGDRSFGDNPDIVARLGASSILGMQDDAGIMACGKHFPGHGDTGVDSHLALPTIGHRLLRLEQVELPPFEAAINAGVGSIMTSHILFPALDPELPATLSPAILTGLLRNSLAFDGIVITDCLEMKGVADGWGSAEAAVLAATAGADMLLACHTESVQIKIRQALLSAVDDGRLPVSRIEEANRRISRAKRLWAA